MTPCCDCLGWHWGTDCNGVPLDYEKEEDEEMSEAEWTFEEMQAEARRRGDSCIACNYPRMPGSILCHRCRADYYAARTALPSWVQKRRAREGTLDEIRKISSAQLSAPLQPLTRNALGHLCCQRCGKSSEFAEPNADGGFVCGECRAVESWA